MSHTPGPWKFRESVDQHSDPCVTVYADGGVRIACLYADDGQELYDAKADARLIAAAPELLEALKALLKLADELSPDYLSYSPRLTPKVKAREAIAKAEGKVQS